MTPTPSELLTSQFYAWEARGRGWTLWGHPVPLEPPFARFARWLPPTGATPDDGRHPGLIERLWKRFRGISGDRRDRDAGEPLWCDDEPSSSAARDRAALLEIRVQVAPEAGYSPEDAAQTLLALATVAGPASFELAGSADGAILQFTVAEEDRDAALGTLRTYLPDTVLEATPASRLADLLGSSGGAVVAADYGLEREFMLPIPFSGSSAADPLLRFLAIVAGLADHEVAVLQVLFERTAYPWGESMARAAGDGRGGSFFLDEPEFPRQTREKLRHPLFAAVIRVAARGASKQRAWEIARGVGSGLAQAGSPTENGFFALSGSAYLAGQLQEDMVQRRTRRSGMILSSAELAGLIRVPSGSVRASGLVALPTRNKLVPEELTRGKVAIGVSSDRRGVREVRLNLPTRLRHTHVIGATGSGKSTLLLNLLRQDLSLGHGVCLLDPHGDLADAVLEVVPKERESDVVVIDPSDRDRPVGFNPLRARTEREREVLASDLVAAFRRLATSWGDQMTAVLGNAVLALLDDGEEATLLDLRQFLLDPDRRRDVLRRARDPIVRSFWTEQFDRLPGRPQIPILTRLDSFLRPPTLRGVVVQRESRLDLSRIMERGSIVIARLSQGAIGEENAYLLGTLLISKLNEVALSRESVPTGNRRPFFLYVDECHHFACPSLAALLSGARKYGVGLVLAHQELHQIKDAGLESALLTNPTTRICFRVGDEDARKLERGFASFTAEDLTNLRTGEAVCRVGPRDCDFSLSVPWPPAGDRDEARERRARSLELSREQFGTPREEVEQLIREAFPERQSTVVQEVPAETSAGPSEDDSPAAPRQSSTTKKTAQPKTGKGGIKRPAAQREREAREPEQEVGGRGGAEHKYLQSLIWNYAKEQGCRAMIEHVLPGGGRVDVLIEAPGFTLACEVSITTRTEDELANIGKCLDAGIPRVAVVSPDRRKLKKLEQAKGARWPDGKASEVVFLTPQDLFEMLASCAAGPEEGESTVRGYRVRRSVRTMSSEELEHRRKTIADIVLRSLRRMKDK